MYSWVMLMHYIGINNNMAKGKKNKLEAITELELVHPYSKSQETVIEMVNKWGMRLIKLSTFKDTVTIGIPVDKFKTIFGEAPSVGNYKAPGGTTNFILSVKVKKINILE